jgi:hypothetical protein
MTRADAEPPPGAPPADPPSAARPAVPAWRRWLPVVLGAGLIAFVASRIDFDAFAASVARTNLAAFLGFTALFTASLLTADAFAGAYVYRRLVGPIGWRELVILRGGSYLPSLLNHHVGQAWLTYAIARTCKASILRVAGATLFAYATTLACVFLLGAVALALEPARFPWLTPVIAIAGGAGGLYLAVVGLRPGWLARYRVTAPLAEAGVRGHLAAMLRRAPHVTVLFLGSWLPFLFFAVDIPLVDALVLVPPLMVLVALPITPMGVGTRDTYALQLFAVYAAGTQPERLASVAAATLCTAIALTIVQTATCLIFIRPAAKLIARAERAG